MAQQTQDTSVQDQQAAENIREALSKDARFPHGGSCENAIDDIGFYIMDLCVRSQVYLILTHI